MMRLFSHFSICAPRLDVFVVSNQPKHLMSDYLALFGVIRALPIRTALGKVDKQL